MQRNISLVLLLSALLLTCAGCAERTDPNARPWKEFMLDLADTARFARMDTGTTRLLSSYDRTGGNDDFNYYVRESKEPGWVVLADLKGPGCVRRFWTTGVDMGHPFKIYFDGERKPRLSGNIEELFGGMEPFRSPLARYLNLCWWSYVPLTYNKSLRIETLAPPIHPFWGPRRLFFQLNIEDMPNASVQTFPEELTSEDLEAVKKVAAVWSSAVKPPQAKGDKTDVVDIPPGEKRTLLSTKGPGTLTRWSLDLQPAVPADWTKRELAYLLQDAVLQITYDNASAPSVDVPVGDFFLNGWRKRELGSLPLGSGPSGYVSALPLPFQQSISIELKNDADHAVSVSISAERTSDIAPDMGYLHAQWRRSGPAKGKPHLIAEFSGTGKYIGCFLGVTGRDKSWWILEGDEAMYVDGESIASWRGTGLEDYFNGGWYYRGAAFSALHGILDRAPFRTAQYRFHLVDPVHFSQSLLMDIERGDQNVSQGYMRSVAYAYLDQPTAVSPAAEDRNARRGTDSPFFRPTFMLQLVELERMNNFREAIAYIDEYLERFPDAEEAGIYRLRALEYRRLLGEDVSAADYEPFLAGTHGDGAAEQAKLLSWFHESPGRALIGMCANGQGKAYLDGKEALSGDHPYQLFVTGVDLTQGDHVLSAEVVMARSDPWLQLGIRTHGGIAGTGPDTLTTREASARWKTGAVTGDTWAQVGIQNVPRGIPDAPYIGGIPNAFVLLQSKVYGVRMPDWGYYKGTAYFRVAFSSPLSGVPTFTPELTGLTL